MKIKVEEYLQPKWFGGMPQELFIKLQRAMGQGIDEIEVEDIVMHKLSSDIDAYKAFNQRINDCALWNNQGIAFEKEGETGKAIEVYEKNIADGYLATHSYDRLIKIYRRIKRYEDELRVIKLAIEIFTRTNEEYYLKACQKPANKQYLIELQIAHETCDRVKNDDGWIIYNPYPLFWYIERIEKCDKLLSKRNLSINA